MPVEKQCASCNKSLAGKRSHAVTCGSTCRGIQWRANKEPLAPVKLMFNIANYELIKTAAGNHGVSIHDYIHARAIESECF